MSELDYIAGLFFVFCWLGFSVLIRFKIFPKRVSLSEAMDAHRRTWFITSTQRDLRMIDTGIVAGLQNGVGFFASATILAIGGCLAALGSIEDVQLIVSDISVANETNKQTLEFKLLGLIALLGYAFFKFGWSFRLLNYCGILLGAIPPKDQLSDQDSINEFAIRAGNMNVIAGRHFTAGLRAVFLSLAYLGWFAGPAVFLATTALVMVVLLRRQYFSQAREVALITKP